MQNEQMMQMAEKAVAQVANNNLNHNHNRGNKKW